MNYTECSNEWIRGVINGTITFRKCPNCDSEGIENQAFDENGDPCSPDNETAHRETCEKCDGIAFIEIPS